MEKFYTPRTLVQERPEVGTEGSLANLRSKKKGPRYYKNGRKVLYRGSDIDAWLLENPVQTVDQNSCKNN